MAQNTNKTITNPYTNRKMITTAEDFYGREEEIRQIYSQLENSQSISIVGSRRIGKSSLLYCLTLPEIQQKYSVKDKFEKTPFIYIDLLSKYKLEPSQFLSYLLEEINKDITGTFQEYPQDISYRHFERHIEKLLTENAEQIILLLDEFDIITRNEKFSTSFFNNFRSLCNRYNVALVTASYENLHELCHSEDVRSSPFFNIFQTIPLKLFSQSEAERLIEHPLQNTGVEFSAKDKQWILKSAGNHPFYIQLSCYYLFEEKKQTEAELKDGDYNRLENEVLYQAKGNFNHTLSKLSEQEILFLKKIIKQKSKSILKGILSLKELLNNKQEKASKHVIQKQLEKKSLIKIEKGSADFFSDIFRIYFEKKMGLKKNESESKIDKEKFDIEFRLILRNGSEYDVRILDPILMVKTVDNKKIDIKTQKIKRIEYTGVYYSQNLNLSTHTIEYGDNEIKSGRIITRPIKIIFCDAEKIDKEAKFYPEEIEEIKV